MTFIARFKQWTRRIKQNVVAVYLAARDSRTPFHVRVLALVTAAYALSPIDLIPDFIPVIGYLDDLLIVPLGLLLVIRLLPLQVLIDARKRANILLARPQSLIAAAVIVGIWIICSGLLYLQFVHYGQVHDHRVLLAPRHLDHSGEVNSG